MEAPNITGYDGAPNSLPDGAKKSWKTVPDQLENITGDFLLIEDLLDFSNEEIAGPIGSEDGPGDFPNDAPFNADSSTITAETATSTDRALLSSNDSTEKRSHISSEDHLQFNIYNCNPGVDFCVPCDDLAELEWLSNFVEDSFSTGDVHREISVLEANSCSERYTSEILPVPGRARSKRSRAPVCNWVSRVVLSPSVNSSATTLENASTAAAVSSTESPDALPQGGAAESLLVNKFSKKKKLLQKASDDRHTNNSVLQAMRKCTHCGTQKTPQWRAGPMGPKTLCNACGVRFKSGRLLPEYRPAASPTFIVTKHSNSHKKVLEMRRQKDHYGMYDEDDDQPMEELVQGLQDYRCSEEQSYFSHSDDACLLHNTRQDFI